MNIEHAGKLVRMRAIMVQSTSVCSEKKTLNSESKTRISCAHVREINEANNYCCALAQNLRIYKPELSLVAHPVQKAPKHQYNI